MKVFLIYLFSNLVHDKENVTADLEAEHDILAITFNEGVICVMFIQVKEI